MIWLLAVLAVPCVALAHQRWAHLLAYEYTSEAIAGEVGCSRVLFLLRSGWSVVAVTPPGPEDGVSVVFLRRRGLGRSGVPVEKGRAVYRS